MVQTLRQMQASLRSIVERNKDANRSLEEYLRAVYCQIYPGCLEPSYDVFVDILERAFTAPAVVFNPAWMATVGPPDVMKSTGINCVVDQLIFLISDLRRMRDAGILDAEPHVLYGGVDSPTGHRWYNLEPHLFLACAANGAVAIAGEDADLEFPSPDWTEFASILDLGRDYE
jgi:hypothetical protein